MSESLENADFSALFVSQQSIKDNHFTRKKESKSCKVIRLTSNAKVRRLCLYVYPKQDSKATKESLVD